jgi:formylglycine-generating enzyme required for sulfatase activity
MHKNLSYFKYLENRFRYLDFKGMGIYDQVPIRLPLVEMYVPLKARIELPKGETWTRQMAVAGRKIGAKEAENFDQRLSEAVPVLDLLKQHDGLIILGDPGAGKTTLLKYIALRLALAEGEALGLGQRLPILLPLSAYANAPSMQNVPLDQFITGYYRDRGIDFSTDLMLNQELAQGGVLFLLDGLDEVRDLTQRHLVVDRVVGFFTEQRQKGNKFILTSRIVGYREVRPSVDGLAECTLVDLEGEEISQFVEKWTSALERASRGDTVLAAEEANRQRVELLAAVDRNPGMRRLAANPLLLTILALMKRQGIVLPERRVELYQKYVETLLKYWNQERGLDRPPSRDLDVVETVRVLAPLALWMHETSKGMGVVKREEMRKKLEEIYASREFPDPGKAANQLLADVHEYASLLLERGPGEYGFIHLTLQEYLAAVAITQRGQRDVRPVIDMLTPHVGDDSWHEVALLTVGYIGIIQQRDEAATEILLELIKKPRGEPGQASVLAGEAVIDAWPGGVTDECKAVVIQVLQESFVNDAKVKPIVRAGAGRALARLDDPRESVTKIEKMEFCFIPPGPFWMGEGEDEHLNESLDYHYWVARYPVTNAQFLAFVKAGGYHDQRYWKEAQKAEVWDVSRQQVKGRTDEEFRGGPYNFGEPFTLPNHPVVGITWYEALAFARWLTEQLQRVIPEGYEVRLASEAEWEKGARGGEQIPSEPIISHGNLQPNSPPLTENPQPKRLYPWLGDTPDPNCANYYDAHIGTTSAVGCFLGGTSPYGIQDLAGNVWEWTRSLWGKDWEKPDFIYPYHPKDPKNRCEDSSAGRDILRVLRGGSFDYSGKNLRCANRYRYDPDDRFRIIGFRIVVSPSTP